MDENLAIDTYTFSITIEILSIAMAETLLTTSMVISFSAQSSYHICQTQTWCRNLCKSLKNLMIFFSAKGTLSEDTIRRFLRQLGRL